MFEVDKKLERVLKVAKYFLENGGSVEEVSNATGFSKSSVQRYLNDKLVVEHLGMNNYTMIHDCLTRQKYEGKIKGGNNFAKNNIPLKDEKGNFSGSKKR